MMPAGAPASGDPSRVDASVLKPSAPPPPLVPERQVPASHAGRAGLAFVAAAGSILLAAALLRVSGAADAFVGRELVTLDGDCLYHLRRMRLIADAFPRVPWVDAMIAWPDGAPIPWAAGFDLLGAVFVLAGRALGGPLGGDLWVAALPAVLGVAVVAATMELVHALLPGAAGRRAAALAAGVLAATVPQSLAISRFGRIDHHVAEALAMVLLARWAIAALPPREEPRLGRRVRFELAGAALSAGAVAVFTGSPLYVAIALPILLAAALAAPRPALLGSGGPGLLAGGALAALASAPAVAAHGRALAFGFPSFLQPLLLALAGAAVCAAVLVGRRVSAPRHRIAWMIATCAALALAAALAAPIAGAQTVAAIREWILKSDPWIKTIEEFQPLGRRPSDLAGAAWRQFGVLGLAAPVFLSLAPLGARPAGRLRAAAFLWVTLALAGLTLEQMRFGRVFAPFLAASGALALAWLASLFPPRARLAPVAAVAAALAIVIPDPRVHAAIKERYDPVPLEIAIDLRERAPGPAPGVLAPWDLGNVFLVLGRRPVVATGFGPYPDAAAYWEGVRAFKSPEVELLPWLERRRVGWVVAGAVNLFARVSAAGAPIPFQGRGYSPRWLTEVPSAPLLIGGSGIPALGVRHFEHLLPLFASTRRVIGIDPSLPVLWTYEVVPGARLSGRAPPGVRVTLEIPLEEHGHAHKWKAFADAGGDGRWTMTVPLPTDLAARTVRTAEGTLRIGGAPARPVRVAEAAVRTGATIEVADAPARAR
jgi:hypothetical protein